MGAYFLSNALHLNERKYMSYYSAIVLFHYCNGITQSNCKKYYKWRCTWYLKAWLYNWAWLLGDCSNALTMKRKLLQWLLDTECLSISHQVKNWNKGSSSIDERMQFINKTPHFYDFINFHNNMINPVWSWRAFKQRLWSVHSVMDSIRFGSTWWP